MRFRRKRDFLFIAILLVVISGSVFSAAADSPLTMQFDRRTLRLPAGMSGRFQVLKLNGWAPASAALQWSIKGLPKEATVDFSQMGWGDPSTGPVIVTLPATLRPHSYALTLTASDGSREWSGRVLLRVTACTEVITTGLITRTGAGNPATYRSGGPSSTQFGMASPALVLCRHAKARTLTVNVEKATDEIGKPIKKPAATFVLYRELQWPAEIAALGGYEPNVAEVARTDNGSLTWDVIPGAYLLFFDQTPFIANRGAANSPGRFYPRISVTYSLAIGVAGPRIIMEF